MFRLLRWLFSLFIFGVVMYFAATVELGNHTLLGHIWRIAHTQEAKDLANGTKEEAKKAVDKAKTEIGKEAAKDNATDEEKAKLDKLVQDKTGKTEPRK